MKDTAAQLRRLLSLVPHLADGKEHRVTDVAARLRMSAEDVVRDLHALSERFGDPPGWIEKVQVFVRSDHVALEAGTHFKRPMRLAPRELRAMELGFAVLRAEGADAAMVDRAQGRLSALVTQGASSAANRAVTAGKERDLQRVPALRDALKNRRRVTIYYQKGSGKTIEKRPICPFSFAVERGVWYMVAHCDKSKGIRVFRLDRIHAIELSRSTFDKPDQFDVSAVLKDRKALASRPTESLRVHYSARIAKWIREREAGEDQPDGSVIVDHPLADDDWAVRHVLQYGAEAEVISPARVRRMVVSRLRRMSQV